MVAGLMPNRRWSTQNEPIHFGKLFVSSCFGWAFFFVPLVFCKASQLLLLQFLFVCTRTCISYDFFSLLKEFQLVFCLPLCLFSKVREKKECGVGWVGWEGSGRSWGRGPVIKLYCIVFFDTKWEYGSRRKTITRNTRLAGYEFLQKMVSFKHR